MTVLLRSIPPNFADKYPNVKIVKGDYDSFDILAEAASLADIVVRMYHSVRARIRTAANYHIDNGDSDHEPSINAIIAGLRRRSAPSFLLHLSGTAIVSDFNSPTYLGKLNPKIWSDIEDIDTIASLPDTAIHRNTEKILNATTAEHGDKIKIAIMCPPDIYGRGKGPGKTWSSLVPVFINEVKKLDGRVFYYGEGTNTRSWVHIDDVMTVYLNVIEAAASGGGNAQWGKDVN